MSKVIRASEAKTLRKAGQILSNIYARGYIDYLFTEGDMIDLSFALIRFVNVYEDIDEAGTPFEVAA